VVDEDRIAQRVAELEKAQGSNELTASPASLQLS